jgi:purine-cytosine permease-like protein
VEQKREEMERNELDAAQHASRLGNIFGFATVASHSHFALHEKDQQSYSTRSLNGWAGSILWSALLLR